VIDDGLTGLESVDEARGLGLSSDQGRLYVTTRAPDGLAVLDITLDPASGIARNTVLGFTPLPNGPDELVVIPRTGQRDLVAISCTTSDTVALYDDEIGALAGLVQGVVEPFGLARSTIANNPSGARLFVASFGNHTVDVIDIPDVARPRTAALVGHLGFGAHRPLGVNIPEGVK
jgi:DNA-binding beta-propeller fold protein YncE